MGEASGDRLPPSPFSCTATRWFLALGARDPPPSFDTFPGVGRERMVRGGGERILALSRTGAWLYARLEGKLGNPSPKSTPRHAPVLLSILSNQREASSSLITCPLRHFRYLSHQRPPPPVRVDALVSVFRRVLLNVGHTVGC